MTDIANEIPIPPEGLSMTAPVLPIAQRLAAFTRHHGGPCPLPPEQLVETLILTADGIGSGGVGLAGLHSWESFSEEGGLGTVVGYRLADHRHEPPMLGRAERYAGTLP